MTTTDHLSAFSNSRLYSICRSVQANLSAEVCNTQLAGASCTHHMLCIKGTSVECPSFFGSWHRANLPINVTLDSQYAGSLFFSRGIAAHIPVAIDRTLQRNRASAPASTIPKAPRSGTLRLVRVESAPTKVETPPCHFS